MVEAGADEIPEADVLLALELAHMRDPADLRRDRRPALAGRQAEVGRPRARRGARRPARRSRSPRRSPSTACARRSRSSTRSWPTCCPTVTMESTEDDMVRELQVRNGLASILEKKRLAAVEGPVRAQFESELRGLTDAEQDSKELKSRKRDILFSRILDEVELPFPVGSAPAEGEPAVKDSITKQYVKRACRGDLQGHRPQEDRDRQAAPGRTRHRGDPPDRVRGRASHRAPTAPVSSRAGRRRS